MITSIFHPSPARLSVFRRIALLMAATLGMAGCHQPPSDDEMVRFMHSNRALMDQAIAMCKRHPALRSVDIDGSEITVNKYQEAVELRPEELAQLRSFDTSARFGGVRCGHNSAGEFLGADFLFFATRLGMRVSAKALMYSTAEPPRFHPSYFESGLTRKIAPHWYLMRDRS